MPAAKRPSLAFCLWVFTYGGQVDATSHVCVDKDPSANMHLVAQVPLR